MLAKVRQPYSRQAGAGPASDYGVSPQPRFILPGRDPALSQYDFLLYDTFPRNEAAPLASPRVSEVGGLTLVQTDGEFYTDANGLNFPAQTTPAWGDQFAVGDVVTRGVGKACIFTVKPTAAGADKKFLIGFSPDATPGNPNEAGANYIEFMTTGYLRIWAGVDALAASDAYAADTTYYVAIVQRTTGAFYLIKGGAYTTWTLLAVDNAVNAANQYPCLSNYAHSGALKQIADLDLGAYDSRFRGQNTFATSVLTAPAAGATATMLPDAVLEVTVGTAADTALIRLRKQDATNYMRVAWNATGNLAFASVVNGTPSDLAFVAAGGVANGSRIVTVMDGAVYKIYVDNALKVTYTDPSNLFLTATGIEVNAVGAGGGISSLIAWPRNNISLPVGL